MNTRWFKQNRLLVGFVVAFVVVFGYVGWLLWGQYGVYKQVRASLNEKLAQLEQLQNNNPTPTDSNITLGDENHKHIHEAQRELNQLVLRITAAPPARFANNIEFAQHLRKTVAQMEDSARKARMFVPKDFRFGFTRYATTVPRKGSSVILERLGKQLLVIQKLTAFMIEAGVEEIDAIKRVEIEPLPAGVSPGEDALADSITIHPQEHCISMPFELHLGCSAPTLQNLLNRIATSDKFFVIRFVTIEQEVLERKTDETEAPLPLPATTDSTAPTDTETKPAPPAVERPPRLRVNVRLDFIEVLTPKAVARAIQ